VECAGILPDQGHAAFDIGGLVVFLDHGLQWQMAWGLESRRDAPSQHDRHAKSRIKPAVDGLFGAYMVPLSASG
jgi:hypothetical protein